MARSHHLSMANAFITQNAANKFGIDAEDFAEIVDHDEQCEIHWPVWVLKKNGQPVAWYCECSEVGFVAR